MQQRFKQFENLQPQLILKYNKTLQITLNLKKKSGIFKKKLQNYFNYFILMKSSVESL